MKPIGMLSLSLLVGLTAGGAAAQEIQNLVRVNAANTSANPAVTRSIAEYIAARNSATVVQVMARSRPENAPTMTVEALLTAIESNARIVEPVATATPAAVTPPPEQPPAPAKKKVVKQGGRGGSGGAGSGASGGGGGGGGW
jgi:uncharacterized membrane protein YgcG